jgi:hypothetical protein
MYYNTTDDTVYVYDGTSWLDLAAGGGGSGDITAVVAGSGLTGGATSGSATLSLDTSYVSKVYYQTTTPTGGTYAVGDVWIDSDSALAGPVGAGSTSAAGALQLTDSVSSTSVSTAATPNSVKSAYDLANTALPVDIFSAYNYNSSVGGVVGNMPIYAVTTTVSLGSSGTVSHHRIIPFKNITVSNISFTNGSTASSGLTLCRFGIYTRSGTTFTLVARTASDTTIFNSTNTKYTRALDTTGGYPATYNFTAGNEYWVSLIQVGTTISTLASSTTAGAPTSAIFGFRAYTQSSQSDLPSTSTAGTSSATIYAEVS